MNTWQQVVRRFDGVQYPTDGGMDGECYCPNIDQDMAKIFELALSSGTPANYFSAAQELLWKIENGEKGYQPNCWQMAVLINLAYCETEKELAELFSFDDVEKENVQAFISRIKDMKQRTGSSEKAYLELFGIKPDSHHMKRNKHPLVEASPADLIFIAGTAHVVHSIGDEKVISMWDTGLEVVSEQELLEQFQLDANLMKNMLSTGRQLLPKNFMTKIIDRSQDALEKYQQGFRDVPLETLAISVFTLLQQNGVLRISASLNKQFFKEHHDEIFCTAPGPRLKF